MLLMLDKTPMRLRTNLFDELTEKQEIKRSHLNGKNSCGYYPFGMVMPGRSFQESEGYRDGFDGIEKDDEIKESGNSYTAQFRALYPRTGSYPLTRWRGFVIRVQEKHQTSLAGT